MTVTEMIDAAKMGVDKTSAFESAAFDNDEILYWLNDSQLDIIKQKVFGNNFRKEGYDDLYYTPDKLRTKRSDDLSNLIRYSGRLDYAESNTYPLFRPHDYHPNVAVVNITPTTTPHYLYYIGADFKSANVGEPPMETQVIEQAEIGRLVQTPTNTPFLKNAYVYLKEGEVNFIYDPFITPLYTYISYVFQPKKLTLTPTIGEWETDYESINWDDEEETKGLIPESVHPEIVATAVNKMLENVADPRYQTHSVELTKKE